MLRLSSLSLAHLSGRPGKRQQFSWGSSKVRGRMYYRFHKPIGKGSWRAYSERYEKPKELEAKQRLVYDCKPTYEQYKQSMSWVWRLPKETDSATSPDGAIEAYTRFREKHPKIYHSMNAMSRIVKTSTVENALSPRDWRLRMLLNRLTPQRKKVINKPRLAMLYASLKCWSHLDRLARMLIPMLSRYRPEELVTIVSAFGKGRLFVPALMTPLTHFITAALPSLATSSIIRSLHAFARIGNIDLTLFSKANAVLLDRPLSLPESVQWLQILGRAKCVDFAVAEAVSVQARDALALGRGYSPKVLAKLLEANEALGICDIPLMRVVINHASEQSWEWSVDDLAVLMDIGSRIGLEKVNTLKREINDQIALVEHGGVFLRIARAAGRLQDRNMLEKVAKCLPKSRRITEGSAYQVGELMMILMKNEISDFKAWRALIRDLGNSIEFYEPNDFILTASVLANISDDLGRSLSSPAAAMMLAEWSIKRKSEFDSKTWKKIQNLLCDKKKFFFCGDEIAHRMAKS